MLIWNGYLTHSLNKLKNSNVLETKSNITILDGVLTDITKLIQDNEDKVVSIQNDSNEILGSGIIYKQDENKVYLITNSHVLSDNKNIFVKFANGEILETILVGEDSYSDIAILSTNIDFKVDVFNFFNSANLRKGEYVIALGAPYGLENSVSFGVVSGINRKVGKDLNNDGLIDFEINAIQTDATLRIGNSGGPLLNLNGDFIGLVSMKVNSSYNLGFAISSSEVKSIADEIIENGFVERIFLGINVNDVSSMSLYQKSFYGISIDTLTGVYVKEISIDSPAYQSGIRIGDIITKINDVNIKNDIVFSDTIYKLKDKESITLSYIRNNEQFTVEIIVK